MLRLVAPLGLLLLLLSQWSGAYRTSDRCIHDLPYAHRNSGSHLGPRDLSCYRVFNKGDYKCSWQYDGPAEAVSHFLWCCFVAAAAAGSCCYFPAGAATWLQFTDQDGVPVRSNVTLWVESRVDNRTARSPEVTLLLNKWVRYDAPPKALRTSLSRGLLSLVWEAPEDSAQLQLRRRSPRRRSWELGDCEPQDEPGLGDSSHSKSCLCPLEADMAQEFQFRWRRRLQSGVPGGPWSDWSSSECIPPESLPQPEVKLEVAELGQNGRRRLTVHGQLPQPELPEGCLGVTPGAKVTYLLRLHMRSCPCQAKATRIMCLGKRELFLSGGAYDVAVVTRTRLGRGPNQTWHIPAVPTTTHAGPGALNVSAGVDGTGVHWEVRAQGVTHCVEWRLHGQDTAPNCSLQPPRDPGPAGAVTHSWSPAPGMVGQDLCYHVTILASVHPERPTAWWTVLSTYHFGGNASVAGTPPQVWVQNQSERSVAVAWAPSALRSCPGVLKAYVVCCGEDGGRTAERLVSPTETQVTLQDLQPGATYTVQVRADTAWLQGAWSLPQRFSLAPQESHVSVLSASVGSFVTILLLGALGYLGLSRATRHLCPPLPTPCASAAVTFEDSQGRQCVWTSPVDFAEEETSPPETLVVEMCQDRDEGPRTEPPRDLRLALQDQRCAHSPRAPLLLGDLSRRGTGGPWWACGPGDEAPASRCGPGAGD
ncbi:interleukin-12 receptor subunit beta-1 [Octodon degus]|uniref:Interleukin-12 receptor subunit beta-1 n=1 Tax=Octodon degus TaxID=10160 RepID=A0A6P6DSK5_OCTDE|nr:interleukin-12 receptor subunit beta-1 [Octodon degus]